MAGIILTITLAIAAAFAHAQERPEFDVATLKLSPPPSGNTININLGRAVNGRVDLGNATLSDCIKFAYGIASDAQLVGPEWIRKDIRFDVVGRAAPDTSRERLLLMLQTLLADRLKLVIHHEPRELSYLAMAVGRNGPKLPPSSSDVVSGPALPGRIVSTRMNMQILATLLSRFERQTILDKTGLTGFFQVRLEWTPDSFRDLPLRPDGGLPQVNGQTFDPAGPSLYTAIQEQLGLRLESRKGPVDVLVVDSAEKTPAEN